MATRVTISITVLLFLFTTLSRARQLQNTLLESKPETTTRSKPEQHDTVLFNLNSIDHRPLKILDFRPINRHIHPQHSLPFPLSLSLRRCRHGHRREISYGNDMILSNIANTADRQIPAQMTTIRSSEVTFPQVMRQFPHHDHSEDHHNHHHHHHEKGWFARKIHEFLNLF